MDDHPDEDESHAYFTAASRVDAMHSRAKTSADVDKLIQSIPDEYLEPVLDLWDEIDDEVHDPTSDE
jgi:hypothetical protein